MSVYRQALELLSPMLALIFWVATWLLVRQGRRRLGSVLWCGHAAFYWSANAALRWWFGYDAPTLAVSAWASIVFVHAGFSMLWMAAWLLRYESSPDSSR